MGESNWAGSLPVATAIPWVVFFILPYANLPRIAIVVALVSALYAPVASVAHGRSIKVVDLVTVGFFALGTVAMALGADVLFQRYNLVIASLMFGLMAWISIAIARPFTLQFARETAPREIRDSPGFLKVSQTITLVWSLAFTINLIVALLALGLTGWPATAAQVSAGLPVGFAIVFTDRYSSAARRAAGIAKTELA